MNEKEFKQLQTRMNKYKRYDSEINKLKAHIETLEGKKEVRISFDCVSNYWLVSGNEKNSIIEIMKNSIKELEMLQENL